jgi:hypothetical protein
MPPIGYVPFPASSRHAGSYYRVFVPAGNVKAFCESTGAVLATDKAAVGRLPIVTEKQCLVAEVEDAKVLGLEIIANLNALGKSALAKVHERSILAHYEAAVAVLAGAPDHIDRSPAATDVRRAHSALEAAVETAQAALGDVPLTVAAPPFEGEGSEGPKPKPKPRPARAASSDTV